MEHEPAQTEVVTELVILKGALDQIWSSYDIEVGNDETHGFWLKNELGEKEPNLNHRG